MPDSSEYPGTNEIAGNVTSPTANSTKLGVQEQNPLTTNDLSATTTPPAGSLPDFAAGTVAGAAPAAVGGQPDVYGGNFGNDVQPVANDPNRAANQQNGPNRGAFGEQGTLGATHGGYGNQFRDFDTAAERPAAEANEEHYYGDGASRPGMQHNSYCAYSGQDTNPAEQGHAVRDTPAPPAMNFQPAAADNRSNAFDNRNLPSKDGPGAAFQNDNGAPTVGPAYADDYGHTSGVGLPAGTPTNHLPLAPDGHGQPTDPHTATSTYDDLGISDSNAPAAPATSGAPAPVNAPNAPQGEGYGYGYQRSEQAHATSPGTGDARTGYGSGTAKTGDASQGVGSQGGSYNDQNPGARGAAYDNQTDQDKAQNYGQEARQQNRPAGNDDVDHGPAPRRNHGRDDQ